MGLSVAIYRSIDEGYLQENGQLAGNYPTEENASTLLQLLNVICSQGRVRSAVSNGLPLCPS